MDIEVNTFSELYDELDRFFSNYGLEKFVVCPTEEIKNLRPKEERVCRFCGLDYSQTTFNSKPHIISELLGNKYLISDFECDRCNKFFGDKYENDLTAFLGMSRTLFAVKNNDKVPTFNSPGYKLQAKRKEFYGIKDGLRVSLHKSAKGIFKVDVKSGKAEIKYLKQPYTPIKVYKALLKIALSIIPEEYVEDYQYVFKHLKESDSFFNEVAKIAYYELPYNYSVAYPVCFLFRKLETKSRVPSHVFMLYYQSYIFQFPIPFSLLDKINNLADKSSISVPLCPPILFSQPASGAKYYRNLKDLSSEERIREEEFITFSFEPNIMSNMKAYDGKTGEVTDTVFNPDDIAEIYIAPYDSRISLFDDLEPSKPN